MGNESCVLRAFVLNSSGEYVESNLYNPLKQYSRTIKEATDLYTLSKDQKFREIAADHLLYDDNGEPTFSSFIKAADVNLEDNVVIPKLEKQIGTLESDYMIAVQKARDFNRNHELRDQYLASVERVSKDTFKPKIVRNTPENIRAFLDELESQQIIMELDDFARKKLNIGTMFTEDANFKGKFSLENVNKVVNGLHYAIQIGHGENIPETMAEEVGHAAVNALGEHSLIKRLEKLCSSKEVQKLLLGDEYDSKDLGNNPSREVAGFIVGKALINLLTLKQKEVIPETILQRVVKAVKNFFGKLSPWSISSRVAKAKEIASEIVQGIDNGQLDTVSIAERRKETLYKKLIQSYLLRDLTINENKQTPVENFRYVVQKLSSLLNKLKTLNLTELSLPSLKQISAAYLTLVSIELQNLDINDRDITALYGIATLLQTVVRDLAHVDMDQMLKTDSYIGQDIKNSYIDDKNEQHIFKLLHSLNLMYETLHDIYLLMDSNYTTSSPTPNIWKVPTIDGKIVDFNITLFMMELSNDLGIVSSNINGLSRLWFVRFLERVYGSSYITHAARKMFIPRTNSRDKRANIKRDYSINKIPINYLGELNNIDFHLLNTIFDPFRVTKIDKKKNIITLSNGRTKLEYVFDFQNGEISFNFIGESKDTQKHKLFSTKALNVFDKARKALNLQVAVLDGDSVPISEYVTGANIDLGDISIFAAWLSAMLDCGDVVQGICKQAIDLANRKTIKATEVDRNRLNNMFKKMIRETGNSDTSRFYKRRKLADGGEIKTGYLIARLDYGRWEANKNAMITRLHEEFIEGINRDSKYDIDSNEKSPADLLAEKDPLTFYQLWHSFQTYKMKQWHKINSKFVKGVGWVPYGFEGNEKDEGKVDYNDIEYAKLSNKEREFLDEYFEWKQELESKLSPGSTVLYRAPQYGASNKLLYENFKENKPTTKGFRQLKAIGNLFGYRFRRFWSITEEDRYNYGTENGNDAFEDKFYSAASNLNEDISRIPMLGVRLRKNPNDLSTDLLAASYEYSFFVNKNHYLLGIVDSMEVGKRVLLNRKIDGNTELGSTMHTRSYDSYLRHMNRLIYNKGALPRINSKFDFSDPKFVAKYRIFMNRIKRIGTMLCLGWNPNPAIVNVSTGTIEIRKEAQAGEYYNNEDFRWAMRNYLWRILNFITLAEGKVFNERDADVKLDSIGLFLMYADVLNNYSERIRKANKTYFGRLIDNSSFFMYSITDNYMQGIPALAMAHHTKLYDTFDNNKPVTAYDIYHIIYEKDDAGNYIYDKNGKRKIHSYGYDENRYSLYKDGATERETLNELIKLLDGIEGTEYDASQIFRDFINRNKNKLANYFYGINGETEPDPDKKQWLPKSDYIRGALIEKRDNLFWNDLNESHFFSKVRAVNARLHGIYSQIDAVNALGYAYGSASLSMKGYALGMLERRWSSNYYNVTLDKDIEGSYVTMFKMLFDNEIGLINKFNLMANPLTLNKKGRRERILLHLGYSDLQIANMRRFRSDVTALIIVQGISYLLGLLVNASMSAGEDLDEDEDEEGTLFWKYVGYSRALGLAHFLFYKLGIEQMFMMPGLVAPAFSELTNFWQILPPGVTSTYTFIRNVADVMLSLYRYLAYRHFDSGYYDAPDPNDYEDGNRDPLYKEDMKEYRSKYKKLFEEGRNLFKYEEEGKDINGKYDGDPVEVNFFDTKPMRRFLKSVPTPFKFIYKLEDPEKEIRSNEFYRDNILRR